MLHYTGKPAGSSLLFDERGHRRASARSSRGAAGRRKPHRRLQACGAGEYGRPEALRAGLRRASRRRRPPDGRARPRTRTIRRLGSRTACGNARSAPSEHAGGTSRRPRLRQAQARPLRTGSALRPRRDRTARPGPRTAPEPAGRPKAKQTRQAPPRRRRAARSRQGRALGDRRLRPRARASPAPRARASAARPARPSRESGARRHRRPRRSAPEHRHRKARGRRLRRTAVPWKPTPSQEQAASREQAAWRNPHDGRLAEEALCREAQEEGGRCASSL